MHIGTTFRKLIVECLRGPEFISRAIMGSFAPSSQEWTLLLGCAQLYKRSVHTKQHVPVDAQPSQEEEDKRTATSQSWGGGAGARCGFHL